MKHFALPVLLALLAGCSTSEPDPGPAEKAPEGAPIASASFETVDYGRCGRCNAVTYEGHQCGRTIPCRLCEREAGALHRHALTWNCVPCQRTYAVSHVCVDSKSCPTCRTSGPRRMPPRACDGCGGIVTALEAKGVTSYCGTCNLEVGANHIHGKTSYCGTCEREAGANHVHRATRLCPECQSEAAPDHQHGVTAFCSKCGLDQGLDHRHGTTLWCIRCKAEKVDPHTVHAPR